MMTSPLLGNVLRAHEDAMETLAAALEPVAQQAAVNVQRVLDAVAQDTAVGAQRVLDAVAQDAAAAIESMRPLFEGALTAQVAETLRFFESMPVPPVVLPPPAFYTKALAAQVAEALQIFESMPVPRLVLPPPAFCTDLRIAPNATQARLAGIEAELHELRAEVREPSWLGQNDPKSIELRSRIARSSDQIDRAMKLPEEHEGE